MPMRPEAVSPCSNQFQLTANSAVQSLDDRAPSCYSSIDGQHDDRADHRHDPACSLTLVVQAKCAADERADERTDDAEQDRDDDAARVFAGHHELSKRSDDESDNDGPEDRHRWPRTAWKGLYAVETRSNEEPLPLHQPEPVGSDRRVAPAGGSRQGQRW